MWRFGFGRSVSGSTFSEGLALTQDDAKVYWGKIGYVGEDDDDNDDTREAVPQSKDAGSDKPTKASSRLQVKGSVILGLGLEPQPVARFIMREKEEKGDENDDEEEEEEEENDELEFKVRKDDADDTDEQGIDWSSTFQ